MNLFAKLLAIAALALSYTSCGSSANTLGTASLNNVRTSGPVVHVVAFRFKTDSGTRARIPGVVQAFADLEHLSVDAKNPNRRLIQNFKYGVNNSTEQVSFGKKGSPADRSTEYDFVLTFKNIEDRDYYVNLEPHHQEFKKLVGTVLENGVDSVFVTDFAQR